MDRIMRNLDGFYFRIGTENICWSDLTEEQMNEMLEGRSEVWLRNLCIRLGQTIREIGDQFDIVARMDEENIDDNLKE